MDLKPIQDPSGETTVESDDSRDQLQPCTRETIKNAIADTLKRHIPFSGHEELQELKKIVERVEEEIYNAATNQPEYHKMTFLNYSAMDTRLQNIRMSDPGSQVMQQLKDLEQHVLIRVTSDNIQQMMPQIMHTNIGSTEMQQPPMTNVAGQNLNWQNIHNMSSVQQNYLNGQRYNYPYNVHPRLQQQSLIEQQMKLSSLLQESQQLLQSQQLQLIQQSQQLNGQSLNMSSAYRNQQSQLLNGQGYSNHNSFGYGAYIQQQLQNLRMQQQGLISQQNRLSGLQQPSQQLIGQNVNLQNLQNMPTYQGMLLQSNKMPTQQQNQQMLLSSLQLSQQLIGQILNLQNLQNMSIDQGTLQSNKMPSQPQIPQSSANMLSTQVQQSQQLPQQVMLPHMQAQVQQSQPQLPQQVTLSEMQSSQLGQLQP